MEDLPLMTLPTPMAVWKGPRPGFWVESNSLPLEPSGFFNQPVYSMVTVSPFWGLGPLPSEMTVLVTPIVLAVEWKKEEEKRGWIVRVKLEVEARGMDLMKDDMEGQWATAQIKLFAVVEGLWRGS